MVHVMSYHVMRRLMCLVIARHIISCHVTSCHMHTGVTGEEVSWEDPQFFMKVGFHAEMVDYIIYVFVVGVADVTLLLFVNYDMFACVARVVDVPMLCHVMSC